MPLTYRMTSFPSHTTATCCHALAVNCTGPAPPLVGVEPYPKEYLLSSLPCCCSTTPTVDPSWFPKMSAYSHWVSAGFTQKANVQGRSSPSSDHLVSTYCPLPLKRSAPPRLPASHVGPPTRVPVMPPKSSLAVAPSFSSNFQCTDSGATTRTDAVAVRAAGPATVAVTVNTPVVPSLTNTP